MDDEIDSSDARQIEQFLSESWAAFLSFTQDCGQSETDAAALMSKLRAKAEG